METLGCLTCTEPQKVKETQGVPTFSFCSGRSFLAVAETNLSLPISAFGWTTWAQVLSGHSAVCSHEDICLGLSTSTACLVQELYRMDRGTDKQLDNIHPFIF